MSESVGLRHVTYFLEFSLFKSTNFAFISKYYFIKLANGVNAHINYL